MSAAVGLRVQYGCGDSVSRPVVGAWAERAYAGLGPYTEQDEALGWPLLIYLGAVGDQMFQEMDDLGRDQGSIIGWGNVFNPSLCPAKALPWLGQFVGVEVDTTLSEANQRAQVAAAAGWQRGTPASIISAVQLYLTGTKYVSLQERFGGNAYALNIITHTAETPVDTTAMVNAVKAVIPAGFLLTFATYVGQTYAQLRTTYATYTAVKAAYATYDDVRHG